MLVILFLMILNYKIVKKEDLHKGRGNIRKLKL